MKDTETAEGTVTTKPVTAFVVTPESFTDLNIKQVVGVVTTAHPGILQVRRENELTQYAYDLESREKASPVPPEKDYVWFATPSDAIAFVKDGVKKKRAALQAQLDALPTVRRHAFVVPSTTIY